MSDFVEKIEISAQEKVTCAGVGRLKEGKEIAAQFRTQIPGQKAVNKFVFTDGTDLTIDDDDNSAIWPGVE